MTKSKNLRTIILRLKSDNEVELLEAVQSLLDEKTASKALMKACAKLLQQKKEIDELRKNIAAAWDSKVLYKEKVEHLERILLSQKSQTADALRIIKRKTRL